MTSPSNATSSITTIWQSGIAFSQVSGSGNVLNYQPVNVGNGWTMVRSTFTQCNTTDSYQIALDPGAGNGAGTTTFYVANVCLFGFPVYSAISWAQPRQGTARTYTSAGIEDCWVLTNDNILWGTLRWIPMSQTDFPYPQSGFYGANETIGLNSGVMSWMLAGMTATQFFWCADSSNALNNVPSYLFYPQTIDDDVSREDTGELSIEVKIRNSLGTSYTGY